jgi:hypothetical protein
MTMRSSRLLAALVAVALGLAAAPAMAAEPTAADLETARALMKEGKRLRAAGDFAGAVEKLRAAHQLVPTAVTGYQLAAALADQGQLVEARAAALDAVLLPRASDETEASERARTEARALAGSLEARIPSLHVTVSAPPGVAVSLAIDGSTVPAAAIAVAHRLDPGLHAIAVRGEGAVPREEEVTLAEGETRELAVTLAPASAPPLAAVEPAAPSVGPAADAPRGSSRVPVYVSFGAGGFFLIAGGVTGVLAFTELSSAKSHCHGNECSPAAQGDLSASTTLGTVSTVAFVLGGVAALTGVVLYEVGEKRRSGVGVDVGPGSLVLRGRF